MAALGYQLNLNKNVLFALTYNRFDYWHYMFRLGVSL